MKIDTTLTPEFVQECFRDGVIGTKEFRNWLAEFDPLFNSVRDSDIDNEIDAEARRRQTILEQGLEGLNNQEDPALLVDREGKVKES